MYDTYNTKYFIKKALEELSPLSHPYNYATDCSTIIQ